MWRLLWTRLNARKIPCLSVLTVSGVCDSLSQLTHSVQRERTGDDGEKPPERPKARALIGHFSAHAREVIQHNFSVHLYGQMTNSSAAMSQSLNVYISHNPYHNIQALYPLSPLSQLSGLSSLSILSMLS